MADMKLKPCAKCGNLAYDFSGKTIEAQEAEIKRLRVIADAHLSYLKKKHNEASSLAEIDCGVWREEFREQAELFAKDIEIVQAALKGE